MTARPADTPMARTRQVAEIPLVAGLVVLTDILSRRSSIMSDVSYGGRHPAGDTGEAMRLVLAAAVTRGSTFRRNLLGQARNAVLAPPLEIGIDKARLLRHCQALEKRENMYRLWFLGVAVAFAAAWLWFGADEDTLVPLAIAAGAAAALIGAVRELSTNARARQFTRDAFDFRRRPDASHPNPDALHCVGPADQNVVVYRDFFPFDFAGTPSGGWAIAIDTGKRANGSRDDDADPIAVEKLENALKQAVTPPSNTITTCRELLVVHGTDADILPQVRRADLVQQHRAQVTLAPTDIGGYTNGHGYNGYLSGEAAASQSAASMHAPEVALAPDRLRAIAAAYPNLARRYLWFSTAAWGGDITFSNMIRFSLAGRILFVEHKRFLMAPIAAEYRGIDQKPREKAADFFVSLFAGAIKGPFAAVLQPLVALGIAIESVSRSFGLDVRRWEKAIEEAPRFNYGSETSLRRSMMSETLSHYYQRVDIECFSQSFDKVAIEALACVLEEHGIDVTDLRNKEMTIYNSGILVQSGDVSAEAIAVGQGAAAQTNIAPAWRASPAAAPQHAKAAHA